MVLEANLHPTVRDRMARNLANGGIDHRVEDVAILLPIGPQMQRVVGLLDELLSVHARILHYADPAKAKPYKPLERDILVVTLAGVLDRHQGPIDDAFLADFLHSLVWAQGLPNTNHRSTLALVSQLAFPQAVGAPLTESLRGAADRFIMSSKPLIREAEFTPGVAADLKRQHLANAAEYVKALRQSANPAKN